MRGLSRGKIRLFSMNEFLRSVGQQLLHLSNFQILLLLIVIIMFDICIYVHRACIKRNKKSFLHSTVPSFHYFPSHRILIQASLTFRHFVLVSRFDLRAVIIITYKDYREREGDEISSV